MWETWIQSLGWEDPLEKEMATHSLVFLPGEFHGQRSLVGYSPWVCKELDMTDTSTGSNISSLLPYIIGHTDQFWGKNWHNSVNTQGRPSLGAILETGCHPYRQFWILLLSKYNHAIYMHLHAFLSIKILYFSSYQSGNHESNSLFVLYLTLDSIYSASIDSSCLQFSRRIVN